MIQWKISITTLNGQKLFLLQTTKKKGIKNYIGINSIMEIGMAFNRDKKIFILFETPNNCKEEFQSIKVIELKENLSRIT